jgi:hypothetical protein
VAKSRSPSYPAISLKEALARAGMIYAKDHLNRVPKAVLAEHMGYKSLSGASLPILSALNQYGLLDGRGDETRISQAALNIIVHEPGSSADRLRAIREAAFTPELFSQLVEKFPGGRASDAAIRAHLLMIGFIPAAADTALRSYRETIELLNAEEGAYKGKNPEATFQVEFGQALEESIDNGTFFRKAPEPPKSTSNPPSLEPKGLNLMEGERELTTGLLSKEASFRLIVSGPIGEKEIDRLIRKLQLDKEILAESAEAKEPSITN